MTTNRNFEQIFASKGFLVNSRSCSKNWCILFYLQESLSIFDNLHQLCEDGKISFFILVKAKDEYYLYLELKNYNRQGSLRMLLLSVGFNPLSIKEIFPRPIGCASTSVIGIFDLVLSKVENYESTSFFGTYRRFQKSSNTKFELFPNKNWKKIS